MIPLKLPVFALLLASLAGCASLSDRGSAPADVGEPQVAETDELEPIVPEVLIPMTEDTLYAVLAGEIAGHRGRFDISARQYLFAARLSRSHELATRAARIAIYSGDMENARSAALLMVELEPDNLEGQRLAALFQVRAGEADQAAVHIRRILELSGEPVAEAFLDLVKLFGKEEDPSAAIGAIESLLPEYPQVAEAWFLQAMLKMRAEQREPALAHAEKALELRPDWDRARVLVAQIRIQLGQVEEATGMLRDVLSRMPDNHDLRRRFAELLVKVKHYDEALEQYLVLNEKLPDDLNVEYVLALLAIDQKKLALARKHLVHLFENDHQKLEVAFMLAQIEDQQGNFPEAVAWYRQVSNGERLLDAQIRIAVLTAEQGHVDEAREQLRGMRKDFPDARSRIYLVEGEVVRKGGDLQAVYEHFSRAVDDLPDNSDLRYARALSAERVDRLDILESDLRLILISEPDHIDALNALGYTLADRTDRLDEASKFIHRAYALDSESPAIIDSMGWLAYRQGDFEKSLTFLRKAYEMVSDSEIAAHLAEVQFASGREQEARATLKKALAEDPTSRFLVPLINRFESAAVPH